MERTVLTDGPWQRIEPFCLGKAGDPEQTGGDVRLFVEAVFYVARTGCPWRDLPPWFGKWNSVFCRFRHWTNRGAFVRIFDEISKVYDLEHGQIEGTVMRVHRHGPGAKAGPRARQSAGLAAV